MPPIGKVDDRGADRLVGLALDAGVNLFDTANTYGLGESERMLGRALGTHRDEVLLATKFGFTYGGVNDGGLTARHAIASAEASLKRLQTDWIDLLQLHKPDPLTPLDETLSALDQLVRRGLVRHVGFCNFPAWQAAMGLAAQRQAGWAAFASAQVYWSLVGRDVEDEIEPFCREVGIGLLVWSPLAAGLLTDRWRATAGDPDSRRSQWAFPPVDPIIASQALSAAGLIADARRATVAQVALAWLLAHPSVTSVLIGASTKEQLEDNLGAGSLDLTDEEMASLDEATATPHRYPGWLTRELPDPMRESLAAHRRSPPTEGLL
jgi:aryl-alcohol dehydrogenase-like predicted oxidoreductase